MKRQKNKSAMVAGWRERITLPKLCKHMITAKLDTGAKSAALHAEEIKMLKRAGKDYVRFKLYPNQDNKRQGKVVTAPLKATKWIKSSTGRRTLRPIVSTLIDIGGQQWTVDISLVDRDPMTHRMLIGRSALKDRLLVDSGHSFLQSKKQSKKPKT